MAGASKKQRKVAKPDSDQEIESDESGSYHGQQEIQATFEGRNPEVQDFHGIKQLLLQLFLTAHIDVGQLCDLLISQTGIGSVLKQSCNDSDDEEDMEMVDDSDVFGITSIVNLTNHQETPCIKQLYEFLSDECKKNANQDTQSNFESILNNCNRLGLLINERFVNIPSKISSLMLNSLQGEIQSMKKKNGAYNFEYYVMIIKIWKPKGNQNGDTVFSNDEEEIFNKNANYSFEYSVAGKCDTGLTGKWQSEDKELVPFRRVILFKSDKLSNILSEIQHFVT